MCTFFTTLFSSVCTLSGPPRSSRFDYNQSPTPHGRAAWVLHGRFVHSFFLRLLPSLIRRAVFCCLAFHAPYVQILSLGILIQSPRSGRFVLLPSRQVFYCLSIFREECEYITHCTTPASDLCCLQYELQCSSAQQRSFVFFVPPPPPPVLPHAGGSSGSAPPHA
jgi:hypothetical protein